MRKLVLYNLLLIMLLVLFSCGQSHLLTSTSFQNLSVDQNLSPKDLSLVAMFEPYKNELEADMKKVVGVSPEEMVKNRPESLLTNFLADLLMVEGNSYLEHNGQNNFVDISYFNYGGIRSYLPMGNITVGNIYEIMPFENEMVFLKIKGTHVKTFLDIIAQKGGGSIGGIRFKIKDGKAINIIIGGKPLAFDSEYWLVTNDYIASGGDGMEVFKNKIDFKNSGQLIRDLIIKHLEEMYKSKLAISVKLDGRIRNE